MKLIPDSAVRPSYSRRVDFVGDRLNADYSLSCLQCGAQMSIAAQQFIERWWGKWEKDFNSEEVAALLENFDVSTTSGKSHDGGLPVFLRAACQACQADHIVYAGVQETSTSYYAVWVHGVAMAIA